MNATAPAAVFSGSVSWGSSPCTPAIPAAKDGNMTSSGLLAWAVAPDWLTTAQAANLLGAAYTATKISKLVLQGHIVGEFDHSGQLLVDLRSLSEYRDALWEVATLP